LSAWQGVMTDAAGRVVRREVADIRRAMKRYLGERNLPEFRQWLTAFYREAPEWIRSTMMPVVSSFATAIVEELRSVVVLPDDYGERVEAFGSEYADTMAVRHAARQRRAVEELLTEYEGEQGIVDAVSARLTEWEQQRYQVIGRNEAVS